MRDAVRPSLERYGIVEPNVDPVDWMLSRFEGRSCCFVQIGSNDGKNGDPLYNWVLRERQWTGLLIEPIPYLFERLKANYAGRDGLKFLNAAIAERRGRLILWSILPEAGPELGLPFWFDQLSSFDRGNLTRHFGPEIAPYLIEVDVPCVTLEEALDGAGIGNVDIVHVDAEGYDPLILRQIDFKRIRPSFVLYEHKHMAPDAKDECRRMFTNNGYVVKEDEVDSLAESKASWPTIRRWCHWARERA